MGVVKNASSGEVGFVAADLVEGTSAQAGMKAGGFTGGLTLSLEDGEDGDQFGISLDGSELLIARDLPGGLYHITLRIEETEATLPLVIFVAFAGGPTDLGFEQAYRLMPGTAVAQGLLPVGTFAPEGGLAPFSYMLVADDETGADNDRFRGGDGIYARGALEAGSYRIRVRCTDANGKYIEKPLSLTVEAWAPPDFGEADFVRFPETRVEGEMEYRSPVFKDGRNITIPAFELSKYEVTNALWQEVTGDPPADDPGKPRTDVSWLEAAVFCNALSLKRGLTPVYLEYTLNEGETEAQALERIKTAEPRPALTASFSTATKNIAGRITFVNPIHIDWDADGYRLPCEAEWELAARGGKPSLAAGDPWLWRWAGTDDELEVTKYALVRPAASAPGLVGALLPNTVGLYDMTGNACEWTGEIILTQYPESLTNAGTPLRGSDSGDGKGLYRMLRGGNCQDTKPALSDRRALVSATATTSIAHGARNIGFRLARTVQAGQ
jgi:formylglycine-generating enzyme required for sulfatase activity